MLKPALKTKFWEMKTIITQFDLIQERVNIKRNQANVIKKKEAANTMLGGKSGVEGVQDKITTSKTLNRKLPINLIVPPILFIIKTRNRSPVTSKTILQLLAVMSVQVKK